MKVDTATEWSWVEIPVPVLPSGRQTYLAPALTNVTGSVDVSMITLVGGEWKWLKAGENQTVPAKACFHSAYSDKEVIQLEPERVQAGVAFYAPIVPVLPGRYQITLEFDSAGEAGTVLGTWSVMRSDGQRRVSTSVLAGKAATLEYRLDSPRPLRWEFDYNRKAGMKIQAVKLVREE